MERIDKFVRIKYLHDMDNVYINIVKLNPPGRRKDYDTCVRSLIYETTCQYEDKLHGVEGKYDWDVVQARQAQKLAEDKLAIIRKLLQDKRGQVNELEERIAQMENQLDSTN